MGEQELSMALEKDKKLLEAQCKDTGARADEAEVNALKGGRKAMIKMETRIRELESELDAESRRNTDILKNLRKAERSDLSALRRFLRMSVLRLLSASSSDSSSRMRVSILIMAFLPPLRALTSASSARAPVSLHWASRSFLSFSRAIESSCSHLSSSARRAASTMALAAFSSESLASLDISSRSLWSWLNSDSSFLLAAAMDWLTLLRSARFSLVSASSCSAARLCLSAVSRRARLSSRQFCIAAAFLSAATLASAAADLAWDSASTLAWASLN